MMNRRGIQQQNAATASSSDAATTPTTSALLNESRQLLLKQQLKLQLNLNVSEMMDNLRRSVDNDYNNSKQMQSQQYDGDLNWNRNLSLTRVQEVEEQQQQHEMTVSRRRGNHLVAATDTEVMMVTTSKASYNATANNAKACNARAATAAAVTLATTSFTSAGVTVTTTLMTSTSLSLSSSAAAAGSTTTSVAAAATTTTYTSLTQKQPLNTALAKFNRIIDNTVPVINNYQQQQPPTPFQDAAGDCNTKSQQHAPHEQHSVGMPILSDSLKRRLASHHYTDLVVNNSKINFSYDRRTNVVTNTTTITTTTTTTTTSQPTPPPHSLSLSRMTRTTDASSLISLESIATTTMPKKVSMEDGEQVEEEQDSAEDGDGARRSDWKRNDVHYLLKQLNSFSDIEEIEIVDMKQKQRQQQQQQKLIIREQQQQEHHHLPNAAASSSSSSSHLMMEAKNLTVALPPTPPEQCYNNVTNASSDIIAQLDSRDSHYTSCSVPLTSTTTSSSAFANTHPPVSSLPQYISSYSAHISELTQHSSSTERVADYDSEQQQQQRQNDDIYVVAAPTPVESKQHSSSPAPSPLVDSPTATSLVIYSPSSQSHKGIRRYASLNHQQQQQQLDDEDADSQMHRHQYHSCDPLALQQFVDDYIFQSCHYLETNNFAANYCTAMVESSSHEFRPSTTTTTRTSNEEYDDEECYVEDHSSAHSFELHECEPPTVICKAPAPLPAEPPMPLPMRSSMRNLVPITTMPKPAAALQATHTTTTAAPPHYTMETRLCSSGVQTDLTASSFAQSFSLSSSTSSSSSSTEQRKRKQPIFKCCYTPLDRWREKRQQQQQIELKKRTKTVGVVGEQQQQQLTTTHHTITSSSQQGSSTTTTTATRSCLKNSKVSIVTLSGAGTLAAVSGSSGLHNTTNTTTTTTLSSSAAAIVVHSQHHSLPTKNAPYAV
ncbi:uncharacterized protein LOC133323744 [Musca vetustissima]|uniref:uncharacterized protein LOC133323744 n=1 Tax=Musca vetustissima TaxID=27455 RepID=UPI002AB6F6FD|nr:uncharacterized protein LOC133323744 [Musca vetustissima]